MASRLLLLTIVAAQLIVASAFAQTPAHMIKCEDAPLPPPMARPRTIGGTPSSISTWPWFAALRVYDEKQNTSLAICGGVVVAPNWVLTAGHCLHFIDKTTLRTDPSLYNMDARLEAVLGVDDLRKVTADNIREVEEALMHPDYEREYQVWLPKYVAFLKKQPPWPNYPREPAQTIGKDLALVKLRTPWPGDLGSFATAHDSLPPDAKVRVTGFGAVEVKKDLSTPVRTYKVPGRQAPGTNADETVRAGCAHLMEVTLPVVDTVACLNRFVEPAFSPAIGDEQICAGYVTQTQDSCSGDSGGPLALVDDAGKARQFGIVSWGPRDCAGVDKSWGVYTRVAKFENWIRTTTGAVEVAGLDNAPRAAPRTLARAARPTEPFASAALGDLEIDLAPVKGKVRVTIDGGPVVKLGTEYKFKIESDVDGQLILLDVDDSGGVTQIFPNQFVSSLGLARVQAGAPLVAPSQGWDTGGLRASEPVGERRLIAMVVPDDFSAAVVGPEIGAQRARGIAQTEKPNAYVINLVQQVAEAARKAAEAGASLDGSWAYNSATYKIERGN